MLAHRRSGGRYVPRAVPAGEVYHPPEFEGMEFDVAEAFEAANQTRG